MVVRFQNCEKKDVSVSLKIADQHRVILRSAKPNGHALGSNPCRSSDQPLDNACCIWLSARLWLNRARGRIHPLNLDLCCDKHIGISFGNYHLFYLGYSCWFHEFCNDFRLVIFVCAISDLARIHCASRISRYRIRITKPSKPYGLSGDRDPDMCETNTPIVWVASANLHLGSHTCIYPQREQDQQIQDPDQ